MTPGPQYEFTEEQNKLLRSLSSNMGWVGYWLVVFGLMALILAVVLAFGSPRLRDRGIPSGQVWGAVVGYAVMGLVQFLVGYWTNWAARDFRKIAETQGHDIDLLIDALKSLNRMYSLVFTLMLIGILSMLLSIVVGIVGVNVPLEDLPNFRNPG